MLSLVSVHQEETCIKEVRPGVGGHLGEYVEGKDAHHFIPRGEEAKDTCFL